jgi:hypothetical protein
MACDHSKHDEKNRRAVKKVSKRKLESLGAVPGLIEFQECIYLSAKLKLKLKKMITSKRKTGQHSKKMKTRADCGY